MLTRSPDTQPEYFATTRAITDFGLVMRRVVTLTPATFYTASLEVPRSTEPYDWARDLDD